VQIGPRRATNHSQRGEGRCDQSDQLTHQSDPGSIQRGHPGRLAILDDEHTDGFRAEPQIRILCTRPGPASHLGNGQHGCPIRGLIWLPVDVSGGRVGHDRVQRVAQLHSRSFRLPSMTSWVTRGLSCSGSTKKGHAMVIVSGHLIVDEDVRDDYLADCADVVAQARRAPGCLDFAISADVLDPGRINVFERWSSQSAVEEFRGSGTGDEQAAMITSASVSEYDVSGERRLT